MSANKPKIKTRLETRHFFSLEDGHSNELVGQARKERYREYNENGKVVREINYDPTDDDRILDEKHCTYNENGHLVEEKVTHIADQYEEHRTYDVDDSGKVVKSLQHYEDGSYDTVDYQYDDQNRCTGRTVTDSDGEHDGKEEWSYSENNSVEKRYFDYDGGEEKIERFTYDANGNELQQTAEEFGQETVNISHEYNAENQLMVTTLSDARGDTKISYTYGDNGEVSEEQYHDHNGTLIQQSYLHYNEQNLLTEEKRTIWIGESTREQSRKYEYELY